MSNINPNMKPYKKLPPFKFFTLTNFPYIDEDFDALTNYELMCKIVEYLNEVGSDTNIANENVQELYSAFMSLQSDVQAQIEQGFSELNVQNEVNNKLDEMASSGQLDALILDAIEELNPDVLDTTSRINVVNFDSALINVTKPYTFDTTALLNTTNKALLIEILNYMITNEKENYYFVNPNDVNRVIYYQLNIYNILNNVSNIIDISVKMNMPALNLSFGDQYSDHATLNVTLTDGLVTELTFNTDSPRSYNLIRTNNINSYTPLTDYAPATKKYVDDNAGGGGGSYPYYEMDAEDNGTLIGFGEYYGVNFAGNDFDTFKGIVTDAINNNQRKFFLNFLNKTENYPVLLLVDVNSVDLTSNMGEIKMIGYLSTYNYPDILIYGQNNTGSSYSQLSFIVSITDGAIDSFLYMSSSPQSNRTMARAEDVMMQDVSSDLTIDGTYLTNSSTDPVRFLKEGKTFNLTGTVETTASTTWSNAKITFSLINAPIVGVSGSTVTCCYATAILYKPSTSTYYYIYSNIGVNFDTDTAYLSFSPVDGSLSISQGDAIRFNITYIKNW